MTERERITEEIIKHLRDLKIGQEGVVVIFAKGPAVQVSSLGIDPKDVPMVIENGLASVMKTEGN